MWFVLAGGALAALLGLLAAINPMLGLGALVVIIMVASFTRDGAFAVAGFAATTYFDVVSGFIGPAFSPVKLAGGTLVALAVLAIAVRGRRGVDRFAGDSVAAMLAGPVPGWRRRPLVVALVLAFLGWALVSAAWAVNLEQVRVLGIRLSTDVLIFLAVPVFLQRSDHLRALGWTMLVSGALATAFGYVAGAQVLGRSIGTFTDPNEFAAAVVPAVAFGVVLAESAQRRGVRWAGRACVLIGIVGVASSGSRGGLVAAAVAMLVLVVTARGVERLRMVGGIGVALAITLVWVAASPAGDTVVDRIRSGDSSGRSDLWRVAMLQYADEPVHGVGLGNYPALSRRYLEADVQNVDLFVRKPRVAHSTPLEMLAELGTIGFLLFYGFVGYCLLIAVRGLRVARRLADPGLIAVGRGVLAALLSVLGSTIFLSGQYQELLWVLFGAAVAYGSIVARSEALAAAAAVLGDDA